MNFKVIHQKALRTAKRLHEAEAEMILVLQEVDEIEGYLHLGYTSLSAYMIGSLKFSEAGAHHFITVCRKAKKVPELQSAIQQGNISISKAKTIAPVLNRENAAQWLEIAQNSTVRELERHVAKEQPQVPRVERVRHRSKDQVEITLTVSEATMDLLTRAQELLKQKRRAPANLAESLKEVLDFFVEANDPIRKAMRKPQERRTPKEHALLRDKGSCQFILESGKKCGAKYWIDLHHKIPISEGGGDEMENLITLCSAHHRMVHSPPTAEII